MLFTSLEFWDVGNELIESVSWEKYGEQTRELGSFINGRFREGREFTLARRLFEFCLTAHKWLSNWGIIYPGSKHRQNETTNKPKQEVASTCCPQAHLNLGCGKQSGKSRIIGVRSVQWRTTGIFFYSQQKILRLEIQAFGPNRTCDYHLFRSCSKNSYGSFFR